MKPLVFTSRTAAALWWFILIFYACNVMFLLMLAVVYFNYSDPLSWLNLMAFNLLYTESVVFLQKYHVLIGSLYVLLTLPSLHGIFQMLARCIRKVKSSSGPRQTQLTRMTTVRMILSRGAGGFAATVKAAINSVGMRGKYFTPFLFAIETVEIALQTWQAYRTSRYISNLRINVLYGIAIFINCWSTAVIHYVWEHKRHHPLMARFLSVLVDAILDFAWGVVLQGVLVWRYWSIERTLSAMTTLQSVPENADRELRQILVVSVSNFVLSGFPFLVNAMVLHEITSLLEHAIVTTGPLAMTTNAGQLERILLKNGPKRLQAMPAYDRETRPPIAPGDVVSVDGRTKRWFRSVASRADKMLPTIYSSCMMLYGTIILSISIAATGSWTPDNTGTSCQYRLYPWLSANISCVGRTIDCKHMKLRGRKNEISDVLSLVNPYLLGSLAFENCTELEIPATIREFTGLGTIAIRNSSLLEWENDAVVNATFTTLQTLQFLHVHVSCVPRGIMNEPLPWSLEWVRLEWISGEPFYSHVSVAWQSLVFFTCIGCDLTTIPAVANNMSRLVFYQFTNNSLVTIPTTPFLNKSDLSYVLLSGNPIEQLPDSVWDLLNQLYWLDIRGTNILDIPSDRVATAPSIKIFAFGSPLCATNSSLIGSKVSCDEYSMMS